MRKNKKPNIWGLVARIILIALTLVILIIVAENSQERERSTASTLFNHGKPWGENLGRIRELAIVSPW